MAEWPFVLWLAVSCLWAGAAMGEWGAKRRYADSVKFKDEFVKAAQSIKQTRAMVGHGLTITQEAGWKITSLGQFKVTIEDMEET